MNFSEFMSDMGGGNQRRHQYGGTVAELTAYSKSYLTTYDFKPGDLVQWKKGLKNVHSVKYGKPMVVVEVQPGRRAQPTEKTRATPYENVPEGVRCGVVCGKNENDDNFLTFWYDENRLEPYNADACNDCALEDEDEDEDED